MRHYLLSFIMIIPTTVLAIDCTKTTSEAEKTICNNLSIQRLDAILNAAYQEKTKSADKKSLKEEQIHWIKKRNKCGKDKSCLEYEYISRIKDIIKNKNIYIHHEKVKDLDFFLTSSDCESNETDIMCEGLSYISIFKEGDGKLVQNLRIEKPNVIFDKGQITKNTVNKNSERIHFILEDINFDGFDDLILTLRQTDAVGRQEMYPYIYNNEKNNFREDKEFQTLFNDGLYYPEIDKENKKLTTFSKSGCCWHQTNTWEINENKPILIKEEIEDGINGDEITTKKKIKQ